MPPPSTRRTDEADWRCPCSVCEISRLSLNDFLAYEAKLHRPRGPVPASKPSPPPTKIVICSECKGEIARGKPHKCGTAARHSNLADLAADASVRSRQVLARTSLRSLAAEFNVSAGQNLALASGGSRPMNIVIGTSRRKAPTPQFSHQSLTRVQTALGLSGNKTLQLSQAIRSVFGRNSVESHLAKAIVSRNCVLEDLFEVATLTIPDKHGKEETAQGVFCTDVHLLVAKLIEERELDPASMDVHLGIDNGQGSIKIGLTITRRQEQESSAGRAHYSDGPLPKLFKESSVLRLMLVAVLPFVSETYEATKAMLQQINLQRLEHTMSIDMKMQRIICGKAAGNPTHGCVYCSAARPYLTPGSLYTLADLKEKYRQYLDAGEDKKKQRNFDNVVNEPLLQADDSALILDLLPIPQLHILLGVVDKLLHLIEDNIMEGDKNAGRAFMDQFLKSVHILRKEYQVFYITVLSCS